MLDRNISKSSTFFVNVQILQKPRKQFRKCKDGRLECNICKKRIRHHLTAHLETHMSNPRYSCELCDETFKQRQSLMKHLCEHLLPFDDTCPKCGSYFAEIKELKEHMKEHGLVDGTSLTSQSVLTSRKLEENKYIHVKFPDSRMFPLRDRKSRNTYTCQLCDETFRQEYLMEKHYKKMHKISRYSCLICQREFTVAFLIYDHMRKEHAQKGVDDVSTGTQHDSALHGHTEACDPASEAKPNNDVAEATATRTPSCDSGPKATTTTTVSALGADDAPPLLLTVSTGNRFLAASVIY